MLLIQYMAFGYLSYMSNPMQEMGNNILSIDFYDADKSTANTNKERFCNNNSHHN